IPLTPPKPVKGVIQVAEAGSPLKVAGLSVQLVGDESWQSSAAAKADGTFEFAQLGAERYQVFVGGEFSKGYYLKQIRYGDQASSDGTISLAGSGGNLELILSTRGARLTGTIKSEAAHPQVVLIPVTGKSRLATFDQTGEFALLDVPPGAYRLY